MRDRLQWAFILAFCSLVLALLMQGPQWLHQQSSLAQGIAVHLNSDEAIYLARIEEALTGRPEQSAEAFTGHPNLVGTQFAMLERFYGALFRFTGWRAPAVQTFLDVAIPVLVFLSLVFFFRLQGFSRNVSLLAAAFFCLLQLYNLNRPIHMRSSFLVMLWGLIFIQLALRSCRWWVIPAGIVLGTLVGVYVWSFMFAWAFWGSFVVWEFVDRKEKRFGILFLIGCIGLISATPFILQYIALSHHPLYDYGSYRSGMHLGRRPESIIYSLLFGIALVSSVLAHRDSYEKLRPYRSAFALLLAAFVYMNQQIIHGTVFNFVSHGIFSLLLAALSVTLVFIVTREKWLLIGAAALCVYMAAIGYDGRYVFGQWEVKDSDFENQYFAEMLPALDILPRGRILSDPETESFIASNTHHDIVYSIYLKNVLMTHREIALRYCLTQLPCDRSRDTFAKRSILLCRMPFLH